MSGSGALMGRIGFDPLLVISQITVLQSVYYLTLCGLFYIAQGVYHGRARVEMLFNSDLMSLRDVTGIVCVTVHVLGSLICAYYLLEIVGRSKRCLDFSCTLQILHCFGCWYFYFFPTNAVWWMLAIVNTSAMTLLGEYLCIRRELREIPIQNPDERHTQQATLVQQKEKEMEVKKASREDSLV
eukprot:TRINITY_DN33799_c0_g1_i1.p1 TRINITY_DN33799_c0_g1~~TRINITY_DN33799_c0_g1_i1.p1  ORF type:complete len:184 (+),score=23.32 TRINITY_DN33799_c0_g1_i1:65-616(+)